MCERAAAGQRAAALRLNYAMHSFPAQGATLHGTATLAGHWSQAKQETYVGDTRAIYRHTIHLAREDLGTNGTDEDRIHRYAQRIAASRQRRASIRSRTDPSLGLAVRLPVPGTTVAHAAGLGAGAMPVPAVAATRDAPPVTVPAPARDSVRDVDQPRPRRTRSEEHSADPFDDPPEALEPGVRLVPAERIARERWERDGRRLEALHVCGNASRQPSPAPTNLLTTGQGPGPTPLTPPRTSKSGPTFGQ